MSHQLSPMARKLLEVLKGLQIDGRPVPVITRGRVQRYLERHPEHRVEDACRALRAMAAVLPTRQRLVVRYDPVPEFLLDAELCVVNREGLARQSSQLKEQLTSALAELRILSMVREVEEPIIRFAEYLRPDGLRIELRRTDEWCMVNVSRPDDLERNPLDFLWLPLVAREALRAFSIERAGLDALARNPGPSDNGTIRAMTPRDLEDLIACDSETLRRWRRKTSIEERTAHEVYSSNEVRRLLEYGADRRNGKYARRCRELLNGHGSDAAVV